MIYALVWHDEAGQPTRLQGETIYTARDEATADADAWNDYLATNGKTLNRVRVMALSKPTAP